MSKTLRKLVDIWTCEWEQLHSENKQTQSLVLYIATKVRENILSSYVPDAKKFLELSPEIRTKFLSEHSVDNSLDKSGNQD